jgi:deoxyhypusine synthase
VPYRSPGSPNRGPRQYLKGQPIRYYRPTGHPAVRALVDDGFQAFNAGRLSEACRIFADKMLSPKNDTTIGLTIAGAMTPAGLGGSVIEMMERGLVDFLISTGANLYHDLHYALNFTLRRGSPFLDDRELYAAGVIRIYDVLFPATVLLETDTYIREFLVRSGMNGPVSSSEFHYRLGQDLRRRRPGCEEYSVVARAAKLGVPIYTSSPGDSSIGMNVAWHELMNGSRLMIDPNLDVNEVCSIILAAKKNGCVILGGGSPKNFYLQGQPTLWEVYGIPKGGNDFFIQFTTDQVVWGGLSGATPSEAVSWGKVNPGVLPDTVVVYCDSTIAFPLFCEYAVGSPNGTRQRKELYPKRADLIARLERQGRAASRPRARRPRPKKRSGAAPAERGTSGGRKRKAALRPGSRGLGPD